MRPPPPSPRRTRAPTAARWLSVVALSLLAVTCHDNPVAPRGGGPAGIAVRPIVPPHVDLSGFGLVIDSLRVVVVHALADTLRDTTVYFNPDSSSIRLAVTLSLSEPAETLSVSLILSAGGVPLFTGTQKATVTVGSSSTTGPPISIPLSFTGPGAGVTALHIAPLDSVLHFGDSLRFRVTADSAGIPVATFYTSWKTSDTLAARINPFGILHAPAARKAVYVIVRTPSGAADSTLITFIPTPTALAIQAGDAQSGVVGGPLPVALRVRVTALDALGVKGVPVQFAVLTGGGSVAPTTVVVTDTGGYASAVATLGTGAGPATYQASAAGLTAVTFTETGKPGAPTQLLVSAGAGQSAAVGTAVTVAPAVVAKDTFNNVVPGVAVAFTVPGGRGQVAGGADTTNASGIATVGGWTLDSIVRVDTLTATAGPLTRVFTATGTPGPISTARSVVSLVADSIASGAAATLTLTGRDQYANALTTGGATVAFTVSGGTSTGALSAVTDHGNGTYTATFTGALAGTPDTVHATIAAVPVTSALPTLKVIPGAASLSASVITVAAGTDSSGIGDSVTLTAKDAAGNVVTAGGLTVVFSHAGGTSTGNLSGAVSQGNGRYASVFTGVLAGTATTIGATIGGNNVTSTLPTIQVVPGAASVTTSTVTASQGTVAAGAHSILTLAAKDAAGNSLTSGGLAVVFSLAGGTSTASLSPATAHDNGNGTYTDTLTALLPGTATTVHATIGGNAVTATTPITVVIGNVITATSVVTVDSATLASGDSGVVHLQAKDSLGNNITSGGLTVVFSDSGGTSTAALGATTDHGNGTYTAEMHGVLAGTPTTVHATINGQSVTSSLPTVQVNAGAPSAATSVVSVPVDSVASGASQLFSIQLKDAAGNALTTAGGATVQFSVTFGTSTGIITPANAAFAGAGTDTSRFTGVLAGTVDTIKATVNGVTVTTPRPTIFVYAGPASLVTSTVTVSDSVVAAGGVDTLLLTTRDAAGNLLPKGGLTVVFTTAGGTSTGNIGATTDLGNGTYRAIFTGVAGGTALSVGATINSSPVTSALPTVRVNTTVHVSNILADSTWTLAASPHIVHGYLKISNGATLTIQPGAVVKFDTASGLQVGDTAAAQSGELSLAGTAAQPITLTADSTAVRPGFWKGIELQQILTPGTWTHVLIEGAGGARGATGAESCVLKVGGTSWAVDSLHLRACLHSGVKHWGGTLVVRRSEIDSVPEFGIQALGPAVLTLDTTVIRGAGFAGLSMGAGTMLAQAAGNKFIGNGNANLSPAADIPAVSLPHFGPQDTITGNALNVVAVEGGKPDSSVAAFTLFRQGPAAPYLFNGTVDVGSATGQTMTLDSNVIVEFKPQAALIIGDSAGTRSGVLRSLASGGGNGALLTSAQPSPTAGDWVGLEFGRLTAPDTLAGIHVQFAGDSVGGYTLRRAGIWVRNPTANELVIQGGALAANGSAVSPNNAAGFFVSATGGGVHVYGTTISTSAGFGVAYTAPGVRLVGDTVLGSNISALGIFTGLATTLSPADSVAGSRFSTSGLYPATLPLGALPAIYAGTDSWSGNVRDTMLLQGGVVLGDTITIPRVHLPWRVIASVSAAGNGTLAMAPGDSITFDSSAAIVVGDTLAGFGSLRALAPDTAPIFLGATPGFGYWHGIQYLSTPGDSTLRNVTVDGAGYFQPCFIIDCGGQPVGAIYVTGNLNSNLFFDSLTVRNSVYYAIEAVPNGIEGVVLVRHGQFYDNAYGTLFLAADGRIFTVDSSDIYHYSASGGVLAVVNQSGTSDSVLAQHNWWGDVTGPGLVGFGGSDSIGRTLLDTTFYGVNFRPFATQPYFPVGPMAAVVAAPDSIPFSNAQVGVALDSVRVRAVDAFGRGVPLQPITWTPAPGSGAVVPGPLTTDSGGRAGAIWTPTTVSKQDTVTATSGSNSASIYAFLYPGPEAAVHWQYLPAITEGTVSATLDTATFTASGHVGAIITNAHDAFGNLVQPTSLYFDSLPASGFAQPLAVITKESGDTIWFVDTTSVQSPFQLHATYNFIPGVSPPADSVVIVTSLVPVGVRMHADTVRYASICPTGPGNTFCSQAVTAELFDSAGATLPMNGQMFFQWSTPSPGNPVTIDSTGGTAGATAFVTANAVGTGTLTVTQIVGPPLAPNNATGTVIVQQVAGQIGVSPDTLSTGLGDTVGIHAVVADSGGTPLTAQPPLLWQITPQFPGLVKLDSAADSLQVRLDSGVYSFSSFDWVAVARPFVERAPGDTVFGQTTLYNPIHYETPSFTGCSEGGCYGTVDTVANKAFWTDPGSDVVHVNQLATNNAFDEITVGSGPRWLAVSQVAGDKLYVANGGDGTVSVVDPANETVTNTITLPFGFSPYGIAAADPLGRVYVAATRCVAACSGVWIVPIDVSADTVALADTVHLNASISRFPQGMAFNRNNARLYVAIDSGYVEVVDPVAKTDVGSIMVDPGFTQYDVAVNNVTDTVYVADSRGNIGVIDAAAGTLVNTLPANSPNGLAVDETRDKIYYASTGNQSVVQIDGRTEGYHTLLVGFAPTYVNPANTMVDPKTGTLFAPNFPGMSIYQFYGPPLGYQQFAPAPPRRAMAAAPTVAARTPSAITFKPMTRPAKPAARPRPAVPPVIRRGVPANPVPAKKGKAQPLR